MITYTELTTAVAGNIRIGYNAADLARFQVDENINAAMRHILTTIPSQFLSEAIKTTRLDSSNGIDAYQFPSDFARFIRAWIRYTATMEFEECHQADEGEVDSALDLDRQPRFDYPYIELSAERGFYVRPTPNLDVTEGIRLRYIYLFPTISSTQNCMLDLKWKNLLVYRASALSAAVEGSKAELVKIFSDLEAQETARFLPKTENVK